MTISRRSFLFGAAVTAAQPFPFYIPAATPVRFSGLPASLDQLEKASGGRLGVAVLDTSSSESAGHRVDERFPMCSTFKFLLTAAVLRRVDRGNERLSRAIAIPARVTLHHSPLTEQHAGGTMTVGDLCFAAMTESDNTAANLLLDTIGGPPRFTRFARQIGDQVTRLDRSEPALNESKPGDPRDTTSPAAMASDLRRLLLGQTLSEPSRTQLIAWMVANTTGDDRLRAGLKSGWRVGDKTGSDGETTTNDIGTVWPTGRPPLLIAAYLTECPGTEAKRNAVLANVGKLVADCIAG